MAALTEAERKVLDWIAGERAAILDLIETLVNTDSGSFDKAGVDAAGERVRAFLHARGIATDTVANDKYGDGIRATVGEGGANSTILLMGHRDTVYQQGEAARRPFRVDDGRGSGPGCCDMKAGLAMNAIVLAAFKQFGPPGPLVALFTADEEIGSPSSRALIEQEARRARAVFNAEPGRPNGGVVTGRKGGAFTRIDVTGKAAHAGNNLADGISAIEEIARKIIEIQGLTDRERGVSLNVGTVSGGVVINMVAPSATAGVDLRYIQAADRDAMLAKLQAIVAHSHLAGTRASLEILGEFKPLVATDEFEAALRALCRLHPRPRPGGARGIRRRLRQLRLRGERRRAHHLRRRPDRRPRPFARRVPRDRLDRAPRPGAGLGDYAAGVIGCECGA